MLLKSLPFTIDIEEDEDIIPALGLEVEEVEDEEGEALAIITYDPFDELMNDDEEHVDPETTLQWRNSWEFQVVSAIENMHNEQVLYHYFKNINTDLDIPMGQFFFVSLEKRTDDICIIIVIICYILIYVLLT